MAVDNGAADARDDDADNDDADNNDNGGGAASDIHSPYPAFSLDENHSQHIDNDSHSRYAARMGRLHAHRALAALSSALALALAMSATACTSSNASTNGSNSNGAASVGVAFYPIADIVDRLQLPIDTVVVVPAGQEAHDYDPTAKDIDRLSDVDVFFYLGQGFQPNVETALSSMSTRALRVDLLANLDLLPVTDPLAGTEGDVGGETLAGDMDPHVWLAPANMAAMATVIVDSLVQAQLVTAADGAAALARASAAYQALDAAFSAGLGTCQRHELVTTHRAFGYLAAAYDLTQVSIAGISPSEEPSAKTLEAVAAFVRSQNVTTIFSEENLPADLATTVAEETGATTASLDTAESPSAEQLQSGDDYVTMMRSNLTSIRNALGCA